MINGDEKEKRNKQIALITSLGIHGALLLIFLFIVAWRAPNPPLPEFGIELNFGLDEQGGGEVQPVEKSGSELPTVNETLPDEANSSEEVVEKEKTEDPIVSDLESPLVVKEVKKEPVKEKTKEKAVQTKTKEVKKEFKDEPVSKVTETNKGQDLTNHGDDPGKTGDKGDPQGSPDAKALYGKQGGGGGEGIDLSMSGWSWASIPEIPALPDNEDGRIEFEIECDENGEIVGITTLKRGLSPRAEQLLKEEIRKNSLIRTSGGKVPERSKGKVVFVLKTK